MVGALFYGMIHNHYMGDVIGRRLGPYSDALAEHAFEHRDPDVWRQMAEAHQVAILVEPPGGEPRGFDEWGRPIAEPPSDLTSRRARAERTAADGTRITLYWTLWSFHDSHLPLLAGLLVMVSGVVGAAFWFLHRQLAPLAWLRTGVEAVARGDFGIRVPVVRSDEIGQVARSFNDMAGQVGRMIEDRERLLADVSHELRSPIARMRVALELVPGGDKRDALVRDLREMESLIKALLEREELRRRAGRLEGREIDLGDTAREVVTELAGRTPGVELIRSGSVRIQADPALMKALIQNLVDNGIKFSLADSRPVAVSVEAENGRAVLRVTDDGPGIPAGSEKKVFEPFVKLDRARGHHVGYGLGLNICERIVALHGGTIRLVRREPRGTEALVTLPLRP